MLGENYQPRPYNANFSFEPNKFAIYVINIFKDSTQDFLAHYKKDLEQLNPNENKLRQHFVSKINTRLIGKSLQAMPEYEDSFLGNKGRSDFVIISTEQGSKEQPLFWVEAKRLADLGKSRKKEYVIGNEHKDRDREQNGGIERFKLEKHGKGLNSSGMLGFVQKETFPYWHQKINEWICEEAEASEEWNESEQLDFVEEDKDFAYYHSITQRQNSDLLKLHHFWINLT